MNRQPAVYEVRAFLKENATDIHDGLWLIDGQAVVDRMALDLAELALLTGQRLTRFPSLPGQLQLARRVSVLEQQVQQLMEKVRP